MKILKKILKILAIPFLAFLGIWILLTKTKDQRKEQTLAKDEALKLAEEQIDKKIKEIEEKIKNNVPVSKEEREQYWKNYFKNNPGAQRND